MATDFACFLARTRGQYAKVLPKSQCPEGMGYARELYKDRGDLVIGNRIVETKWQSQFWSGPGDYKFQSAMVDEWEKSQRALSRDTSAYYIFDGDLSSVMVLLTSQSNHWYKATRFNSSPDVQRDIDYAMCPLQFVHWYEIPPDLVIGACDRGLIPQPYKGTLLDMHRKKRAVC